MTQPESSPELTETQEAMLDRLADQGVASYADGASRLALELPQATAVKPQAPPSRTDRYAYFAGEFGLTGSAVLSPSQQAINHTGNQQAQAELANARQTAFVPTGDETISLGQPAEQQDINQAGKAITLAALAAAQDRSTNTTIS